jgi:hypothetical protein
MAEEPLYLYGFVGAGSPPPPASLRGIAARPIELLELGELVAVVSRVPEEFRSAGRIEDRLHDLEWVGEQGALHERVVTWFVDHGGVLPARLLTLYSGAQALRDAVAAQGAELRARLEQLQELREWDLKVSYDAHALGEHLSEISAEVAELQGELAQAAPGRRYLLERKREKLVTEETSRVARRLALEVHERLAAAAREARRLPLPSGKGELPVVLNAAYLVARSRETEVRDAAAEVGARLARLGVEVQLSGPWAPYRFLTGDDPPAAGDPVDG